jgi:dTDP-glucose pyrophosphorylase
MKAVILAAGRGTRLFPITENRTKAMCPVAGKPMIERVMDSLVANGIHEFILVINPDDPEIEAYFKGISKIDAQIEFVIQKEQLGMGHALMQAAPYLQDDFLLSSCDNLVDKSAIFRMLVMWSGDPPPNGILALLRVGPEELTRMGVVEINDEQQILRIVEKPSLEEAPSDIGSVPIYLFSHQLIQHLDQIEPSPRGEYELQDAMQQLIDQEGHVYGLLLPDRIDLTLPEDLLHLNLAFLKQDESRSDMVLETVGRDTRFSHPVLVDPDVSIGSGCQIGPNVYLERGSIIEDGAVLENCVVLRGARVATGEQVRNQLIY